MFKHLPLLLILLSTSANAGEWYAGIGLGKAEPKLELDEHVSGVDVDIPEEYGGSRFNIPVSTDSEFTTYGQKLFVGYDVGDRKGFAFELSYVNFGHYEGTMEASLDSSGTTTVGLFEVPYSISLDGNQTITADLYATTLSLIYSFQLSDRISIFPRLGFSHIKGDVYTTTLINLNGSALGESESRSWIEEDKDDMNVILPMFGVGADLDITNQHFVRAEFERYGHPTKEYVDMYTVSYGFRFN